MKILSPAKINLFLEIGAAEKGFHQLISLVDIVDLYDAVEIKEASSTKVSFHPGTGIPAENTVTKSISLLKSLFNVRKNVSVTIRKNIPPGSGLAGGSSNAASVLKSLVKLWNLNVSAKELLDIGNEIGKDVPLFIHGRRCIMRGFGEKITPAVGRRPLAYFLTVPPFTVSTKEVYSHFDALGLKGNLTEAAGKIKLLIDSIEKKDMRNAGRIMKNRLADAYFDLCSRSEEVRDFLQSKTRRKVFVSGSGGTLFSVFPDRRAAEEKTRLLNIEGWKSYVVESIITS